LKKLSIAILFILFTLSTNAQKFSIQKILKMKQSHKFFESELIKSGMTLVEINEWNIYYYSLIEDESYKKVIHNYTNYFDRIPTNDISKKNNNQYYYVDKKIKTIKKENYREVTFAENYNHQTKKGYSFFKHNTMRTEYQLPGLSVSYDSRLSNPSLTITAPPNLYKYYLDQITSNYEYSDTGMFSDIGVFYEYFSKTTSHVKKKHRVFIIVHNDNSWATLEFN